MLFRIARISVLALSLAGAGMAQSLGYGLALDLVNARQFDLPASANAIQGRTGSGVEGYLFVPFTERWEGRLNVGFNGIRVGSHSEYDHDGSSIQVCEYWRSLRFGVEQAVHLGRTQGPYLLVGGGFQETWVRKTQGNLTAASLVSLAWIFGGETSYTYKQFDATLDSWNPYVSAGLGTRLGDSGMVELRGIWGSHLEFQREGISGYGESREVNRKGLLLVLTLGLRSF